MTSDSPDITGALCGAMEALQDRQILFKYVLDELGIARRSAVVRCFIDALTRGGLSSSSLFSSLVFCSFFSTIFAGLSRCRFIFRFFYLPILFVDSYETSLSNTLMSLIQH